MDIALFIVIYLLITYCVGTCLFCFKFFRYGYTPFGIAICVLASPFWVAGLMIAMIGIVLTIPLLYFHNFDKQPPDNNAHVPAYIPDITNDKLLFKKTYKPKFNLKKIIVK